METRAILNPASDIPREIVSMVSGKVGIITGLDKINRYIVRFENTKRPGGYFAFNKDELIFID